MVPEVGLEPTRDVIPRDFESRASASFTTPARDGATAGGERSSRPEGSQVYHAARACLTPLPPASPVLQPLQELNLTGVIEVVRGNAANETGPAELAPARLPWEL